MIIVLDIGGTQMRIAPCDDQGNLGVVKRVATPVLYEEGVLILQMLIAEHAKNNAIHAISIGIAGIVPHGQTALLRSPHLSDWEGHDLGADLTALFSVPTSVHNDVALGGLGEARHGAGKGAAIVAYIAVGTGVGGVRIIDGIIDRASVGFEIGHQLLSPFDAPRLEFESLVSGSALFAQYGKTARELMYDPLWQDVTKNFSVGLYNAMLHWSPDIVVLGGSICSPGGIEAEEVSKRLRDINTVMPTLPPVMYGSLGNSAGLFGACAVL